MEKFNWKTVGKARRIKIGPEIAKGVYRGIFEEKDVAVKSLLHNCASNEVDILRKLDHPNVIRIHFTDLKENTLYLVLDLCDHTLKDYVQNADKRTAISLNRTEVLRQITLGLDYLHNGQKFCAVHRDLKPSNILFKRIERENMWQVKISDFGISKEFETGKTSTNSELKGSRGYVAPELLDRADGSPGPGKIRKEIDIFSLGVIFFYVLSGGKHPFSNDAAEVLAKVRDDEPALEDLMERYKYDVEQLILSMICKDYKERISVGEVKAHHFFWNADKKIDFLQKVSDYFEHRDKHKDLLSQLETMCDEITRGNWKDRICGEDFNPEIKKVIEKRRGWENRKSLQYLLRQIRNWIHHYHDPGTTVELKEELGDFPEGFIGFFTSYFPKLLPKLYELMKSQKEEKLFNRFYGIETSNKDFTVEECVTTVTEDVAQDNEAMAIGRSLSSGGRSSTDVVKDNIQNDEEWGNLEEISQQEDEQKLATKKDFTLVLREYQKELAEQALQGQNSLIIAPTGSGKTAVANEIIKNHIKEGNSRCIFFFVSKTTLARQQYEFFSKHLQEHLNLTDIAYLIGEITTNVAVGAIMQRTKLIVLTPQILIDELNRSEPYISFDDISLMIFDECHNSTGRHPYKVIMDMYMDYRFSNQTCRNVQVVGMTASPGVGNGKTREKVLENLITLLASLNVTSRPTVVERNVDELSKYKNQIEASFVRVNVGQDVFTRQILNAISLIENQIMQTGIIGFDGGQMPKPPVEKDKQKYNNWVVDLGKYARLKEDDIELARNLNLFASHLRMYHNLLYLKNLIPHAIEVVTQDINLDQEGNAGRNLERLRSQLEVYSIDSEVPLLRKLLQILQEEFGKNPESRCIIFVPRRVIASALVDVIKLNNTLEHLDPKSLTGSNEHAERGGMTKSDQNDAVKAFRNGESKLLIATSVAEEGLDIPACNLVIMYNYVTGEVGKIQRAGRGRAESSRSILIAAYGSEQFQIEKRNEICAHATEIALLDMKKLRDEERQQRIRKVQFDEMRTRQTKLSTEKKLLLAARLWDVLCGHCRARLTSADQIKHINNQHRFVVDVNFEKQVYRRPCRREPMAPGQPFEKVATFQCCECNNRVGVEMEYAGKPYPTLLIKQLVFQTEQGERRASKQWSKCPFAVDKAVIEHRQEVNEEIIMEFLLSQARTIPKGFMLEDCDEVEAKEIVSMTN